MGTGAELERRRKLEDVAAKARATGTARVEAAAQERKYREGRAEMDAEYRRNQARLASSRAEDAKMLVAGKASMANAEKMRRRQEKEKNGVRFLRGDAREARREVARC